jgi:hypothetical protein
MGNTADREKRSGSPVARVFRNINFWLFPPFLRFILKVAFVSSRSLKPSHKFPAMPSPWVPISNRPKPHFKGGGEGHNL